MRRVIDVIGLGMVLGAGLLSSGCTGYGYGYHRRYYGGGYAYNNQVAYTQPAPVQQQVVVGQPQPQIQATATIQGEGIAGSDGTRGWRINVQAPDQEFQRLAGRLASCQVEASTQVELRAMCSNVHIVVRFDQQNIYKLCAAGTDPSVCAQVWSSYGQ